MVKGIVYKAFGFHILSEISLPELPQIIERREDMHIKIEINNLLQLLGKYKEGKNTLL